MQIFRNRLFRLETFRYAQCRPDAQESCFLCAKRIDMGSAVLQAGRFADTQDCVFRLRNIQI